MTDAAQFWDRMAQRYAARQISDTASYEYKLERTQAHMRPDMQVLEIACGTGSIALQHVSHVGQYRAVDISPEMLRIARAKPGAEQIEFELADFNTMQIAPDSLDMILAHSVLHLLPDPAATLARVHAALKPGGVFVTSSHCLGEAWWLRPIAGVGRLLGKLPAVSWFTEKRLRRMLTDQGFEIIEDWRPEGRIKALFLVARKAARTR